MEKNTKKLISILLAVFLLCCCASEKPHTATQAPETTEPTAAPTFAETENLVKFFCVSMGTDYEYTAAGITRTGWTEGKTLERP